MKAATRRHARDAGFQCVFSADGDSSATDSPRSSVRWIARTRRSAAVNRRNLRPIEAGGHARTRRRATSTDRPRIGNGERLCFSATTTHAKHAVSGAGDCRPTTSSRTPTIQRSGTFYPMGVRSAFRAIEGRTRTAGAATGRSGVRASAVKRLAQEVFDFGEAPARVSRGPAKA